MAVLFSKSAKPYPFANTELSCSEITTHAPGTVLPMYFSETAFALASYASGAPDAYEEAEERNHNQRRKKALEGLVSHQSFHRVITLSSV